MRRGDIVVVGIGRADFVKVSSLLLLVHYFYFFIYFVDHSPILSRAVVVTFVSFLLIILLTTRSCFEVICWMFYGPPLWTIPHFVQLQAEKSLNEREK